MSFSANRRENWKKERGIRDCTERCKGFLTRTEGGVGQDFGFETKVAKRRLQCRGGPYMQGADWKKFETNVKGATKGVR